VVEIEEEINIDIEALQEIKVKKVIALKIIKNKEKRRERDEDDDDDELKREAKRYKDE